ncbi:MAG: hypothetical protein JWP35_207 [Caulobacter sp.]|nr:hypothetical protein [Caulobacter sp.]
MRTSTRSLKLTAILGAAVAAVATLGGCATTAGAPTLALAAPPAPMANAQPASLPRERQMADAGPAAAPPSSFMILRGAALPPIGFMEFCTRYPAQCGRAPGAQQASLRTGRYDKYYWATAFEGGPAATGQPRAMSRSGAMAPAWAFAPRARFDWSLVFQASTVTPGAGRAAADLAEGPVPATPLSPQLWAVLDEVNRGVNGAIREESDIQSTGVSDHWDLPIADGRRVGDCEDYALEKRRALIARGVPEANLSIALVVTHWGESHAVLVMRTASGDYVLDSLTPNVAPWRALDYRWVERQAPGDPSHWLKVG